MANRHKKPALDSGNKDVAKEAERTGTVDHAIEKKRGGKMKEKKHEKKAEGGKVPGKAPNGRLDRRARGGGVGADKSPYSSAKISEKKR